MKSFTTLLFKFVYLFLKWIFYRVHYTSGIFVFSYGAVKKKNIFNINY